MFCWHTREKWGSWFSLVAFEDCREVCFVGLVVGRNYVWYLVIVVMFMEFGLAGATRWGGCLNSLIGCGDASHKRRTLRREGSHSVILLYCETLLQDLLGIYCKRFYRIYTSFHYITVVLCVWDWQRQKVQLKVSLMILTLSELFRKHF